MSDQGEKTCPLCAEEMDLTDQQLKPCKCGYEICVWCWHHIIDMAEKDDTEGRCPACRIPYDKEKIVGMASNERLAEIQSERKLKLQKPKPPKASDGRKHLSSVRVIQRNLVYIIGIPSNLADEDLLQRREYFAQYGKVLKVSIARTAGGAIQHSPNNTCSVYITYSKEEEAVRCIQLVHGYILEGKPLRACFGTTKYCHAWLRNMTCSNPDCLYLHEIGTQEDSFTKDEIISAYSRVQQITGATNNLQRRSGNTLPPPMDDLGVINTAPSAPSAKPIAKLTTNNPGSHPKGSPPNGSSGRSAALPAAASWGLRFSNGRPPTASSTGLSEPARQGVDTCNGSSTAVTGNTIQGSTLYSDVGIKSFENEESQVQHSNGWLGQLESSKQYDGKDVQAAASDSLAEVVRKVVATTTSSGQLPSTQKDSDRGLRMQPNITQTEELGRQSHASASDANVTTNGTIQSLSSTLSSMGIDSHSGSGNSDVIKPNISDFDVLLSKSSGHHASKQYTEHVREPLISLQPRKAPVESDGVSDSREFFDLRSESPPQALPNTNSGVDVVSLRSYDGRCNMSDGVTRNAFGITGLVDSGHEEVEKTSGLFLSRNSVLPNEYDESKISKNSELGKISGSSNLFVNVEKGEYSGRLNETAFDMADAGTDMGENSIISNILSMDFDAWDDSLTSPHNLVKLLSKTDKQHDSLKLSISLKVQNSNQSRFSFARQEDFANPGSDLDNSFNNLGHNKYSHPQNYTVDRDPCSDKLRNGFTSSMFAETDSFPSNLSLASSSKLAASRSQISAPPGFSIPSRAPAPPPGFVSQERMEQTFESVSGNHLLDSSMLRNQYLAQTGGVADIELIDPAILAVGKGRLPNGINSGLDMRSTYTPQLSPPENDPRLQMLMQQSISQHQNLRYPDHNVDRFSALSDAYRVQSRYLEQAQASNLSPFGQLSLQQSRNAHMLNGHWDKVQTSNELGMAELLRNERLGLNKHYPSYEDQKFRMPSSGDIYKRAFGI